MRGRGKLRHPHYYAPGPAAAPVVYAAAPAPVAYDSGYRLDAGNRSVLLSGDTIYHENVVKYGKGVDVMVHNVVAFSEAMLKAGAMKPVLDKLTTPEQAAQVFTKAAPRLAVFSHIVKKELPGAAGDDIVLERTRKAGYAGPLRMGIDRMMIDVGQEVAVSAPQLTRMNGPSLRGEL